MFKGEIVCAGLDTSACGKVCVGLLMCTLACFALIFRILNIYGG